MWKPQHSVWLDGIEWEGINFIIYEQIKGERNNIRGESKTNESANLCDEAFEENVKK